jgi:DNA-binding transcriptional MerR regulator
MALPNRRRGSGPPHQPDRAPASRPPPEVSGTGEIAPYRPEKSPAAFRTISEVADDLDLPAHVLRFWESKFPQLQPLKRGGGRRYYRPEDIRLLRHIRQCLYQDGYTIRGVQKLLGGGAGECEPAIDRATTPSLFPLDVDAEPERTPSPEKSARRTRAVDPATRAALEELRRELIEVRALLGELLHRPKGD